MQRIQRLEHLLISLHLPPLILLEETRSAQDVTTNSGWIRTQRRTQTAAVRIFKTAKMFKNSSALVELAQLNLETMEHKIKALLQSQAQIKEKSQHKNST